MRHSWEGFRLLRQAKFSGPGVFIPTLLYTLLLHLVDSTVRQEVPMLYRLIFVLIMQITTYSMIKFGRQFLFPVDEGRFQLLKVAILLIGVAAIRAYIIHYFSEGVELYRIENFAFRLSNSIQNIPIAYAVSAIATQAFDDWQARRNALVKDNSRLAQLIQSASTIARAEHQRLVDTVTGQLLRFVREIERSKPADIIGNLRNGISEIVRPLSQEINEHEFVEPAARMQQARITLDQVLRGISGTKPLEPVFMPLAVIWIGLPYVVNSFGWKHVAPFIIIVALVAVSTYSLFQFVISRMRLNWITTWFMVVVAAVFAAVFENVAVQFILDEYLSTANLGMVLLLFNVLWAIMFAGMAGIIKQLGLVEAELVRTQSQLTWALARETEVQRQHSRHLAIALHGPVQTAVGASIIRLENAAVKGEIPQALITEVSELIYDSLEQLQAQEHEVNLPAVCSEMQETWAGICDIQNVCKPGVLDELANDPVASRLVAEIAPELAFNAIKHGEASKVTLDVGMPAEKTVVLTITDNGTAFKEGEGPGGLGLRHLKESALQISRHYTDGVNHTEIVLPYVADSGKP